MAFLTLNDKAVVSSLAVALLMLYLGRGWTGFVFILVMFYFLVISAAATVTKYRWKKKRGFEQRARGVKNVIANSLGPLIFCAVFYLGVSLGSNTLAICGFLGFFAAVASVAADKFGSELGVLDGTPVEIFTLKPVKKGVSGGVTAFGLAVGLGAAFLIGLTALPYGYYQTGISFGSITGLFVMLTIMVSGLFGTITDSMFGYFEERGIGNKYTSNFLCSICGGVLEIFLVLLFIGVLVL